MPLSGDITGAIYHTLTRPSKLSAVGKSYDEGTPPYMSHLIIKEGRFIEGMDPYHGADLKKEWNWPVINDYYSTFTASTPSGWIVHYKESYPLAFYYKQDFVMGVATNGGSVLVDYTSQNAVWGWAGDTRVVVESGDFPRFQTQPGKHNLSNNIEAGNYPNTWRLKGSEYVLATNRIVTPTDSGFICDKEAWWMVGPAEDEESLSRRVLVVKVYDGPYQYPNHGTDLKLTDPVPLPSDSEYAIYSYDDTGLRGLYRTQHGGIPSYKKGLTIEGPDLLTRAKTITGGLSTTGNKIVGEGTITYLFPIGATKLLDLYVRGQEVDMRITPDTSPSSSWENYDGLAVTNLQVDVQVYDELSAFRLEWEGLKDWVPVGRPQVDIIPSGWQDPITSESGTAVRVTGFSEGEGLRQTAALYTGDYTVSANIRSRIGETYLDVGGLEIVTWQQLDKTIRAGGDFSVSNDTYDITVSGRPLTDELGVPQGNFSFDIDRLRVSDDGDLNWLKDDIKFTINEEDSGTEVDATPTINRANRAVPTGPVRQWSLSVKVPDNLGDKRYIPINEIDIEVFRTGELYFQRTIQWTGSNNSRIYYPAAILSPPQGIEYFAVSESGSFSFQQLTSQSADDVTLTIDGSPLTYGRTDEIYIDPVLDNSIWRVELADEECIVYLNDLLVARMSGRSIPFRIYSQDPEDIRIDCPAGLVQLRRRLGPRFDGYDLSHSNVPTAQNGKIIAFGQNAQEASDNLPLYTVKSWTT